MPRIPTPHHTHTVPDPKFDWREIPEALRLLDDGGVSAISSYIFIDGVRSPCTVVMVVRSVHEGVGC